MNDGHTPILTPAERPAVSYDPLYQFIVRILLGSITAVYFYFLPIPFLAFNIYFIVPTFVLYFSFHVIWQYRSRKQKFGLHGIRIANWVDLIGGGIALMIDPYQIPPTLILMLIIVLGNGIQHGLDNFIVTAKNAISVCFISIPVHFLLLAQWPSYEFYFCVIFLLVCAHYTYYLLRRIENLKTQAENLAQLDDLTGLINRRAFIKAARYLISLRARNQIPLVVIFADLDGFKTVNDIFGHSTGDMVLKNFALMAIQNVRKTDIISRYGGDEFVFILTNSNLDNAKMVMSRLETQFINWANIHHINVGLSYGIKEISDTSTNLEDILHAADEDLYAAKRKKRSNG